MGGLMLGAGPIEYSSQRSNFGRCRDESVARALLTSCPTNGLEQRAIPAMLRSSNVMTINKLKRLFLSFAFTVLPFIAVRADGPKDLERAFQSPPAQARPWVYWVWLDGDVPRAAITRDLEEMKAKCIAGCILYDVQTGRGVNWWDKTIVRDGQDYRSVPTDDWKNPYYTKIPGDPLPTWSPPWRELVCFAAGEAARIGVDLVVSDGLANTSGPIPEEYGEQKLIWAETPVHGPQSFDGTLAMPKVAGPKSNPPKGYHRDVAVLAVPGQDGFSAEQVVNLTAQMDATGHLHWDAPAGNWKILRFMQAPRARATRGACSTTA